MNVQYIVSSHPKYTHYRKVTSAGGNKENILITSSLVSASHLLTASVISTFAKTAVSDWRSAAQFSTMCVIVSGWMWMWSTRTLGTLVVTHWPMVTGDTQQQPGTFRPDLVHDCRIVAITMMQVRNYFLVKTHGFRDRGFVISFI